MTHGFMFNYVIEHKWENSYISKQVPTNVQKY